MTNYVDLPVEKIELDISNPRIARGIAYYNPITSDIMALLLGSTSESCASLRESIRENKGIIHPIVVSAHTEFCRLFLFDRQRTGSMKLFPVTGGYLLAAGWDLKRSLLSYNR